MAGFALESLLEDEDDDSLLEDVDSLLEDVDEDESDEEDSPALVFERPP